MRILIVALALATASLRPAIAASDIHLRYAIFIHGLHAIQLNATLHLDGGRYDVEVEDHTVGWIGALIDTHTASHADGTLDAQGLHPAHYESAGHSRGADRRTVIGYTGGNPVVRVLTPAEARRDPVSPQATTGAIDALSALAAIVDRVGRNGRCDGAFHIFDGARLTDFAARSGGTSALPTTDRSPYSGTAMRCDFSTLEVGGFLHDDNFARAHQPQSGTAWLARVAPDAPVLPIRASFSTVDHGPVAAYLVSVS